MTQYQLRPYQQQAVAATIKHFRRTNDSAVIVLPTGSGKSLVISELARLARHKILVLAHVKELVEQNHSKYQSYGLNASIFSAGLNQKESSAQVTFGSVQSVAPNLAQFDEHFSLVIIDECHRIGAVDDSKDTQNQYQQIISYLTERNPDLKVLGLTATPYRMGSGWIYRDHYHGFSRGDDDAIFKHCIYEMPLGLMIKQGYLSPPKLIDAAIAHYDFDELQATRNGFYPEKALNTLLASHKRVTKAIIEQVVSLASDRKGVMIFAATTKHADEIMGYLGEFGQAEHSAIILGSTANDERDAIINQFKSQHIKYLVNVAVLTTGFDAPHVDLIALLRPTQSVSLFQQIIGRGLRLCDDKDDCLIIDYANSGFDIFSPEVGSAKPSKDSVAVMVTCPMCEFGNTFWGKVDNDGDIIEHYGRRCMGFEDIDGERIRCDYRFRFKECSQCGAQNDIAARNCQQCQHAIIDPDELLKKSLSLKDSKVIRCQAMSFEAGKENTLKVIYYDEDGHTLSENYNFANPKALAAFNHQFSKRVDNGATPTQFKDLNQAIAMAPRITTPDFVIAKKQKYYWKIQEKIFDYNGKYRKANQLG
ncbi:DEAD/DEAH box helicase [Psychrobium sp. MM17-31]|uniref:DEAD/DEAH box helicase n=1 Tax=Psychrobium sp. MM17-31 TaxID=2917758 RepID=UPI001EF74A35|nr:DEAD/DEAH box helicase [Psychrobium sp. MM17-31]MCG7531705.1 DEAD/DEAH box helicase [Psychrobium sp. MM17-31]